MYGAKRGYKKRPARKGVSKLTKAKPTAITTLAKAVKSIQSKMRQKTVMLNYGQRFDNQLISGDFDQFKLSNYSSWDAIFGTGANDGQANAMVHKSFGMDFYISSNSETDRTNFTIFLVSLKDDARNGIFNNSNGTLSLSSNIDYYSNSGFTLINKKSFNIHSVKRIQLGNNGVGLGSSTAQTQYGTDRRYYFKMRCNKKVVASGGDWTAMGCSPDPSDNYYLLVFNDNGILDATYPRVQINVVHTVEQLA